MTILPNWRINQEIFSAVNTFKSISCLVVFASILVQPIAVRAFDYTDTVAFCKEVEMLELESFRMEVAEGYLTKEEAAEEIRYIPELEQCICYFEKMLEIAGADFTVQMQKLWLESYAVEDLEQMDEAEYSDSLSGLDIDTVMESSAVACEINIE